MTQIPQTAQMTQTAQIPQTAQPAQTAQTCLERRRINLRTKATSGGALGREEQLEMWKEAEALASQDYRFTSDHEREYARYDAAKAVGGRWIQARHRALETQGKSLELLMCSAEFEARTCEQACPFSPQEDAMADMCLPSPGGVLAMTAMGLEVWQCHKRPVPCGGQARAAAELGLRLRGAPTGEHGRAPAHVDVLEITAQAYASASEADLRPWSRQALSVPAEGDAWTLAGRWFGFRHDLKFIEVKGAGDQHRYFQRAE